MTAPTHIVRGYNPDLDDNLIFDAWTRQIRRCLPANRWDIDHLKDHRVLIATLLRSCPVRVACHPEKQFVIYSYVCAGLTSRGGDQVLHFVYTRKAFRRLGLASKLLKEVLPHFRESPLYFTQNTRLARKLERPWKMVFHPYLLQELV